MGRRALRLRGAVEAAPVGRVEQAGTSRTMPGSPPCGHTEDSCLPCHRRSWNPLGPDRRAAANRQAHHPLGCLRPIPDRIIFDELIQVLVFGGGCAGSPTPAARRPPAPPPRRMDQRRVAEQLRRAVLAAYDRLFGLELEHLVVDGCITKARAGRGPSPVDRRKRGLKRSMVTEAGGVPLATLSAQPITRRRAAGGDAGHHRRGRRATRTASGAPGRRLRLEALPTGSWPKAGWSARSPH